MAVIAKRGTASPVAGNAVILNPPSPVTENPPTSCWLPPAIAGEALTPGQACHYSLVDGKVYASYGGGATAYLNAGTPLGLDPVGYTNASLAQVDGYVFEQVFAVDEAVTLLTDVVFEYCNVAQPVGTKLYVSGTTPGSLDDAASTNGTAWVGKVTGNSPATATGTQVLVKQSRY